MGFSQLPRFPVWTCARLEGGVCVFYWAFLIGDGAGEFAHERVGGGFAADLVEAEVGQAHGCNVGEAGEFAGFVGNAIDLGRRDVIYNRLAGKRQGFIPVFAFERGHDLREAGAAAAEQNFGRQMVDAIEFGETELHTGEPDLDVGVHGFFHGGFGFGAEFALTVGNFHFLGFFKTDVGDLGDALGEGTAADGKHLGAFDAAVVNQRDVGGAAADVDEDGGKLAGILAADGFGDGKRLGRDVNEVEIKVGGHGLERAEMNHGREGVEELDRNIFALEANGVGDTVAVALGVNDGVVHQLHLELLVAGFPRELLAGTLKGAVLNAVKDFAQLRHVNGTFRVGAAVAHDGGGAFYELAGDADHDVFGHHAGYAFGHFERGVAIFDHARDVGNGAALHVGEALALAAHADDFHVCRRTGGGVKFYFTDQRLDEFGANIKGHQITWTGATGLAQLHQFFDQFRGHMRALTLQL